MEKIPILINAKEKVKKASGDSNDDSDLASLVNDLDERYRALYSHHDVLIWMLKDIFYSKRETGSSLFDITHSDTEHSDLKIHGSTFSKLGDDIDVEHNKVLEERKGIEKTMGKIMSLINAEEKVIKSSGDSNDESDLGSLASDFYERYQDLYCRYDVLIWMLEEIFHSKRESGSSSSPFGITHSDTERSDLKIHGSSYGEGKLGEDVYIGDSQALQGQLASMKTRNDEPDTEVDSIIGEKYLASALAKREALHSELDNDSQMNFKVNLPGQEDQKRDFETALCQLEAETAKKVSILPAENEDVKCQKSMAFNKLDDTAENYLQECKNANERITKESLELINANGQLREELSRSQEAHCKALQDLEKMLQQNSKLVRIQRYLCRELSTQEGPIQELIKKPLSFEYSEAVDKDQLQACEQDLICQMEFEPGFMNACKNLVISLQNINAVISNQLFTENRLFEDQFLGFCKNVGFSLKKIEVSDHQHEAIRVLQKACQDKQIEIHKLVECQEEMSEKIKASEATMEGDDKEIKELRGKVQTLEDELCRCNLRLENTEAEYKVNEGEHRSLENNLRIKCKNLEARRSEILGANIRIVGTLGGIFDRMDSTVNEKSRHIQTKLSNLSEELQRVKERSAALVSEKQEWDQEANRMQEEIEELKTKLENMEKEKTETMSQLCMITHHRDQLCAMIEYRQDQLRMLDEHHWGIYPPRNT